ncbi:SH3 domain-containing protein [Candidatus Gracilibacteria bacterium]|nr:SH3 domain-containing protein [Candidatus Gracilibacteria bacterium]
MPAKIKPSDWDRLLAPGAPQRAGPRRAFATVLITLIVLAVVGFGLTYALSYGIERNRTLQEERDATTIASNATEIVRRTAQAIGAAETAAVQPTATSAPATEALLGSSNVLAAGNLRSEPLLAPETIIGQICVGDQLAVLEERAIDAALWYRVRITQSGPNCSPQHVTTGSSGWASSTLLAPLVQPGL